MERIGKVLVSSSVGVLVFSVPTYIIARDSIERFGQKFQPGVYVVGILISAKIGALMGGLWGMFGW